MASVEDALQVGPTMLVIDSNPVILVINQVVRKQFDGGGGAD